MNNPFALRTTFRASLRASLPVACGILLNAVPSVTFAQTAQPRVESRVYEPQRITISQLPGAFTNFPFDEKRAVIGVTLGVTGKSDTLGLLVDDVTKGGPADKAGLKQGARITAIDGVNLRVASSDADDADLIGVNQRRLQREVAKAKAGDEIELRVSENGQSRTVKVRTVRAGDLNRDTPRMLALSAVGMNENRASLGVSIGNTGTLRDTLGLFISSVNTDGPAERAGVFEGDRIAAINGADVRVPKEDADDRQASSARLNRFMRELARSAPGDKITLKVFANGRYRDVQVTAGKNTDTMFDGMRLNFGDSSRLLRMAKPSVAPLLRKTTLPL